MPKEANGYSTTSLPKDLLETVSQRAKSLDVSSTTYLVGLLRGAFKAGYADRHVLVAMEEGLVKVQRFPRNPNSPGRQWVVNGKLSWRCGKFTMTRNTQGNYKSSPEDGWYLRGPSIAEPLFLGPHRESARDMAAPYIANYLEKQAAAREGPHDG